MPLTSCCTVLVYHDRLSVPADGRRPKATWATLSPPPSVVTTAETRGLLVTTVLATTRLPHRLFSNYVHAAPRTVLLSHFAVRRRREPYSGRPRRSSTSAFLLLQRVLTFSQPTRVQHRSSRVASAVVVFLFYLHFFHLSVVQFGRKSFYIFILYRISVARCTVQHDGRMQREPGWLQIFFS